MYIYIYIYIYIHKIIACVPASVCVCMHVCNSYPNINLNCICFLTCTHAHAQTHAHTTCNHATVRMRLCVCITLLIVHGLLWVCLMCSLQWRVYTIRVYVCMCTSMITCMFWCPVIACVYVVTYARSVDVYMHACILTHATKPSHESIYITVCIILPCIHGCARACMHLEYSWSLQTTTWSHRGQIHLWSRFSLDFSKKSPSMLTLSPFFKPASMAGPPGTTWSTTSPLTASPSVICALDLQIVSTGEIGWSEYLCARLYECARASSCVTVHATKTPLCRARAGIDPFHEKKMKNHILKRMHVGFTFCCRSNIR